MILYKKFKSLFLLYCCEALGLGMFMFFAGLADVLIDHPGLPVRQHIHLAIIRRFFIGLCMGVTALYILNSSFGKKSGAHINPSVTIVQYRLGNITGVNAIFYVLFQFIGGSLGMYLIYFLIPAYFKNPSINFIVTQPSNSGVALAFILEFILSCILITTVLYSNTNKKLSKNTAYFVAILITLFITFEAPYSGMYRSRIWQTNEIVPVHLWMQAPADLVQGRYTLVMGLFRALQGERLTVTGANAVSDNGIAASPDFRYPIPSANVDTLLMPSTTFGDTLKFSLQSADVNGIAQTDPVWDASAGAQINLHGFWQALKRPPQDYSVFVHLIATADQPPLAQSDSLILPNYPTGAWRPGDQLTDTLSLTLPADLAPGTYDLVAGVYFLQTGERLAVPSGANTLSDNRVRLGTLKVSSP